MTKSTTEERLRKELGWLVEDLDRTLRVDGKIGTDLEKLLAFIEQEKQLVREEIRELRDFVEEGIQACKDDSAQKDCVGKELHYIFGKSQALKIVKARLEYIYSLTQ